MATPIEDCYFMSHPIKARINVVLFQYSVQQAWQRLPKLTILQKNNCVLGSSRLELFIRLMLA